MKLSVAMIVKNEEKNLVEALSALQALNGKIKYEIVIVDTGSEDNTVEIAKKFTDKIYHHKWEDDFAKMRNISMEYCVGEWILVLDADEVLENAEELIEFFGRKDLDGYKSAIVGISNYVDNESIYCKVIRLFKRKEGIRYEGIVHEQPVNCKPVLNTAIKFLHNGYSRDDYELMIYKFERNKKLLTKQLESLKGIDRIYPLYQLSKTYSMANKSIEAFEIMKEAYDLTINRKDGLINTYVIHSYAQLLFRRGNYKDTIKVCKIGLKYSKNLDYYYMMAISSTELKEYNVAEKYYDEYLNRRKKFSEEELDDVTLVQWSYSRSEEILKQKAINFYLKKEYKKFIKIYKDITNEKYKKQIEDVYLYCLLKESLYEDVFENYRERQIEDSDIEKIINSILKIQEEENIDIKKLKEKLSSLDNRVLVYIETIICGEVSDEKSNEVDFNNYSNWKAQLIRSNISNNKFDIDEFKKMNLEDMESYICAIISDYNCIKVLYEYSESKFLSTDILELTLITIIEKVLMCNESIEKDKYELLCFRAMINKLNLIQLTYKKIILENENMRNVLNEHERLMLDLEGLISICNVDKVKYIRGLKGILKRVPFYKNMINILLAKVNKTPITDEMILEKEKLCVLIEQYINSGQINEAKEILNMLNELFVFDEKLVNYNGVISYIDNDKKSALLNFALASKLKTNNFDALYNIASILDMDGRKEDAAYYYKNAYEVCEDDEMKKSIEDMNVLI